MIADFLQSPFAVDFLLQPTQSTVNGLAFLQFDLAQFKFTSFPQSGLPASPPRRDKGFFQNSPIGDPRSIRSDASNEDIPAGKCLKERPK